MPALETIKKHTRQDQETFIWCLENIMMEVVGKQNFTGNLNRQVPSAFITVSSEAFAYVCVENYYSVSLAKARKRWNELMSTTTQDEDQEEPTIQEQEEEDTRTALYTETGVGAKKFEGWSDAGIERYNKICEDIKVDRDNMMAVEEQYLKQRVEQNNFKIQRKRRQGINGNQRRVAFDEMSDEEEEEENRPSDNSATSGSTLSQGLPVEVSAAI